MKKLLIGTLAAAGLALGVTSARGQPATAGTLYVHLTATNYQAGATTWTNQGTLGNFTRNGNPALVTNVLGTDIPALLFAGAEWFVGPATPADILGANDYSVEVWTLNPSIESEETLFSWGRRGATRLNNGINYGSHLTWGAATFFNDDLGWNSDANIPPANQWHHLVLTYDGGTLATMYVDGALRVQKTLGGAMATEAAYALNVGCQRNNDGTTFSFQYTGYINSLRVHSGLLNAQQVLTNFNLGPANVPASGPVTIFRQPKDVAVPEGQPAVFSATAAGTPPYAYQWYREDAPIAGATNQSYTLAVARPPDSGARFFMVASNVFNGTNFFAASSNALLTVIADTNPPVLLRAYGQSTSGVELVFSEPLDPASATNLANYFLEYFYEPIAVTGATLDATGTRVRLQTDPLAIGEQHTLVFNRLADRAYVPNLVASNSTVTFLATPYYFNDVGASATPGGLAAVLTNSLNVLADGAGIGGTNDQFGFAYQSIAGDFDLQVRVSSLDAPDLWAKAGLMARESLLPGSRFAAALATPSLAGVFFESRAATNGAAAMAGGFPPNYPELWLRLARQGNLFTGYASFDGRNWTTLGSATLTLSSTLLVGGAATSHRTNVTITAGLREFGNTGSTLIAPTPNPAEPLGPCTRRTGLVISEIMYNPTPRGDGRRLEYLEIFNSNPFFHDLGGYRISGDVDYTFPAGTRLEGGAFLVVAANPGDMQAVYSLPGVLGPYTNTLKQTGTVRLRDEQDAVLLEIPYRNRPPWPAAADGAGHSLVLARPSYGEGDPRAWDISDVIGGSPGRLETFRPSLLRDVVINELLPNAGLTGEDYLELHNHSSQTNDLSGCILTDNAATNKFIVPAGTRLPPGGQVAFTQSQLGFGLKAEGDTVWLKNPSGTRVLDAARFDAQEEGVAYGRYPDGSALWSRLAAQSPGASNTAARFSSIVINEIMYHPISQNDDDQYVELYNAGTNSVSLAGWEFVDGISFTFPPGVMIAPDGYLVVARNRTNLLAHHPGLAAGLVLGDFGGSLSHGGEHLALASPHFNIRTNNNGVLVTNTLMVVVNELIYRDGGRWGQWSDGGGSSLELVDARADNRLAPNWADSDESGKAPWTLIEFTGLLDNGSSYPNAGDPVGYAQVGLLDAGECLVDEFEVRPVISGVNQVLNPGFESGLSSWSLQGCFSRSSLAAGAGFGGSGDALQLRTANGLFTIANSAQCTFNTSIALNTSATMRFQGRWLRGCPDIVFRLNGNWLEAAGSLTVPANLGTPGARNSRATNAGPALVEVTHLPALPKASEACVVVARVSDPDGVTAFNLLYRVDPGITYTTVAMRDDGQGGDALAGDGLWSATIPGQNAGVLVAFVLSATDGAGATSRFPALLSDNSPARECLVRFGEAQPTSAFGTYHLWLSQSNVTRWVSLPYLSNEDIDGTLVYGSRVIYNMFARYAGSPYHQTFDGPAGNRACHYSWEMPADDKLLGHASFNKIHWTGNDIQDDNASQNINDATLQREQTANTFLRGLGQPWIYRRHVAVYVNGVRRGQLMEDALRPSSTVPDMYFPGDTGGALYKVQPWFEGAPYADTGGNWTWANKSWSYLTSVTTAGGAKKTPRYRWWYQVRETPDTLNNFNPIYQLMDATAASADTTYVSRMQNLADMENWMRLVAANHAAGNWDCVGIQNGQNVYLYKSPQVGWKYFMFDFSIVLGNRISWGPGQNLFAVTPDYWQAIYANPTFKRMLLRAYKELANGAMQAEAVNPLLDAKYTAFQASGITAADPAPIKTWIASARSSIMGQVAAQDVAAFTLNATNLQVAGNLAVLTGRAPVEIAAINIGGTNWPVTWTSPTDFEARFPVVPGTNAFPVLGLDSKGGVVAGASSALTVVSAALPEQPVEKVVINEIMGNPAVPDAEYIELQNLSTRTAFDLSGWRVNGLGYTFPPGSYIAPRGFLVLAKDYSAFAAAYGLNIPVYDIFSGNLQRTGETLSLLQPGTGTNAEIVVDQVRYENVAPWPQGPPGTNAGFALQLVDNIQDNSRSCNWATYSVGLTNSSWRFVSISGINALSAPYQLMVYLNGIGDAYVDDIQVNDGAQAGVGSNYVRNGDFEAPFDSPPVTNSWYIGSFYTNTVISTAVAHSGNASLHLICSRAGSPGATAVVYQYVAGLTNNQPLTLSFWVLSTTSASNITVRIRSAVSGLSVTTNLAPVAQPPSYIPASPGAANSYLRTLPAIPPLWLNEVQPDNQSGIADHSGTREPWVELYNAGSNSVSLSGLALADNYSFLNRWNFPAGATLNPGEYKVVFCDGQPEQTTNAEWHASFRLPAGAGQVALVLAANEQLLNIDYLSYTNVPANGSYGDLPDGQPFYREVLRVATPGQTNRNEAPPITVVINEWMADNTRTLINQENGNRFSDWIELYNPSASPADLGGCYLTDNLTNWNQFHIPAGWVVPAGGYLLVWADERTDLNTNHTDLHVNFRLSNGGEAVGLYRADGTPIDTVTFGRQTNDVTEGRYPDGATNRYFMTTPTPRAPNRLAGSAEPPQLAGPGLTGNGAWFSFQFGTVTGRNYAVEFKDALSTNLLWNRRPETYPGTGQPLQFSDPTTNSPQRYYRVILLP